MNERFQFLLSIIKKNILTPGVEPALSINGWEEFINYLEEVKSQAEQEGWDKGHKAGEESGKEKVRVKIRQMAIDAFILFDDQKACELRKLAKEL